MKILVLNGGSSTLKAALTEVGASELPAQGPEPLWTARAEWGRRPGVAAIHVRTGGGAAVEKELAVQHPGALIRPLLETLWEGPAKVIAGPAEIGLVGHRVVHGGRAFRQTTRITPDVRVAIRRHVEFAPEHNRLELEIIDGAAHVFGPDTPQVAVFDTSFHATLPQHARVYPVPFAWFEEDGIARYGFHGISHAYVSRRAGEILARPLVDLRLVTCHLGSGASLAAVLGGRSMDTTMGFTPLEGLMMGTRSGSIDPGILIYLVRHCGYTAGRLEELLNEESGLKGLSGLSGDMREILAAIANGAARARLAFDVYTHRLCREIGGMAASLGGIDALVFTAGVGENCPPLRAAVCQRLAFLGIGLDLEKNANPAPDTDISTSGSRVRVLVIRTDEEWEIARESYTLASAGFPD
jgi:acetate kinase